VILRSLTFTDEDETGDWTWKCTENAYFQTKMTKKTDACIRPRMIRYEPHGKSAGEKQNSCHVFTFLKRFLLFKRFLKIKKTLHK